MFFSKFLSRDKERVLFVSFTNLHFRSYDPKDIVEGPVDLEFECSPNIDKDVHDGNIQTVTSALPIVLYSMILEEKETVAVEKVTKKKMFIV